MTEIQLTILKAEGTLLDIKTSSVNLPGLAGRIEISPNHEAMIIDLKSGSITFGQEEFIMEKPGLALVDSSSCKIIIYS
jgi:F0F1-type ATP synthase epsilon subunit